MVELAAESLQRSGRLRLRATGSSMLPAILPGDVLDVRCCAAATVRPGAVILVRREDRLFAHRLARRSAEWFVTRGDAMGHDDPAVGPGDILGEVVAIERFGRVRGLAGGPGRLASRILAFAPAARLFARLAALRSAP